MDGMVLDASDARDQRDQLRPAANGGKWTGGTEVSCRACNDLPDNGCSDEQADICWVCLDGPSPGKPLMRPCKCPRFCHSLCIARWQLQSAGSRKETHCEFCQSKLPEWKDALTPSCGCQAPAVMNVNFGGRTYSFEVQPGPDGYRRFTNAIRSAFALPEDSELNITFTCDEPNTGGSTGMSEPVTNAGSLLTLQGAGAYDAAVHCASVSAARRISTGNPLAQAPIWPSSGGSNGGGASSAAGGGGAGSGSGNKSRYLSNLGRRLRNAMVELFGPSSSGSGAGGSTAGAAGRG